MDNLIIRQLLISVFTILATQGVKKASFIPVNAGQTARIRTVVGIVTFGATAVTAWLNGDLESVISPEMIAVAAEASVSFILALIGYDGGKLGIQKIKGE